MKLSNCEFSADTKRLALAANDSGVNPRTSITLTITNNPKPNTSLLTPISMEKYVKVDIKYTHML